MYPYPLLLGLGNEVLSVTRLHMSLFGYSLFRFTSESSFFRACKIYIIHRRPPSETLEMYLYFELLTEKKNLLLNTFVLGPS